MPRPGRVLGLVGTNGIGKSTALKILAGKMKPNLGHFADPPEWTEILRYFRGSELQNYFTKLLEDDIKATIKPQYVDHIPRAVKGEIETILSQRDERKEMESVMGDLGKLYIYICLSLSLSLSLSLIQQREKGKERERESDGIGYIRRKEAHLAVIKFVNAP